MKAPEWLREWIDNRGSIPWLVRLIWPTAHWCPEMDQLLILDYQDAVWNCYCGYRGIKKPDLPLADITVIDLETNDPPDYLTKSS